MSASHVPGENVAVAWRGPASTDSVVPAPANALPRSPRTVTRASLSQIIKQRKAASPDLSVLIAGDKNVRYEAVLNVMDELRSQSIARVGLQVKPAQK